MDPHYIIHNLYFMYMIWSTKNKPFRDCSLWYRGCYAIGWAIEGCPGKGILDNPHIYIYTYYLPNFAFSDPWHCRTMRTRRPKLARVSVPKGSMFWLKKRRPMAFMLVMAPTESWRVALLHWKTKIAISIEPQKAGESDSRHEYFEGPSYSGAYGSEVTTMCIYWYWHWYVL